MNVMELFAKLDEDAETTLHRFGGNLSLLTRFVTKFPQDPTYAALTDAVARDDRAELERAAHTLKGTAANLGFQTLSAHAAALVNALRSDGCTPEALATLTDAIHAEYRRVIDAVASLG